jgi:hypothetical protein
MNFFLKVREETVVDSSNYRSQYRPHFGGLKSGV